MQDDLQTMAGRGGDGVSVHAGFPNPALDAQGSQNRALALDINQLLIRHPSSTYLFRINGHGWADQGIFDGDMAVVDRAMQAGPSDLLIVWRGNDTVICRQSQLEPDDQAWGVVTAVVHSYRS
jgi:SOS-response transcriptional repressor LexA